MRKRRHKNVVSEIVKALSKFVKLLRAARVTVNQNDGAVHLFAMTHQFEPTKRIELLDITLPKDLDALKSFWVTLHRMGVRCQF